MAAGSGTRFGGAKQFADLGGRRVIDWACEPAGEVSDGVVVATPDRSRLVAVQTPQAFRADVLRRAHAGGAEGTDDAALVEAGGGRVVTVPGDPANRKITEPTDLDWARQRVSGGACRP